MEINPQHRKFLRFQWTFEDDRTRFFHFNVLSLGLSSACYVFIKVQQPFINRWRSKGIKAIIYIDDGIAEFRTFELAKSAAHLVRINLISAGFVINEDQSNFIPQNKKKMTEHYY